MHGMMRALAKRKTQCKEDLFLAVKLAWQKLSKYYTEVTPTTGIYHISTHILDPCRKLRSCWKWDKWTDINPDDETSYTTHYHEAFLNDLENEYCVKHQGVPVNKPETVPSSNFVPSASA
jgi:hypothetical protein